MTGRAPAPNSSRRWGHVLSAVIAVRVVCAGLVWYCLVHDLSAWALGVFLFACFTDAGVFLFACFTDAIDGHLARRWRARPSVGPYADPIADFFLVLTAFSAFVVQGIYPLWVLLLISVMFLQFVWTSGCKRPVYDPVGKYYGLFLFAAVGITLAFPTPAVCRAMLVGLSVFTAVSVVSRVVFLLRRARGINKPGGYSNGN